MGHSNQVSCAAMKGSKSSEKENKGKLVFRYLLSSFQVTVVLYPALLEGWVEYASAKTSQVTVSSA